MFGDSFGESGKLLGFTGFNEFLYMTVKDEIVPLEDKIYLLR